MAKTIISALHNKLEHFSQITTEWAGTSNAFLLALLAIIIWAVLGPYCDYSDEWQLTVNTGTTIITFIMVFLIQRTQNKDNKATHLKLNELIASHYGASNRLINIEDLTEEQIAGLYRRYRQLQDTTTAQHTIEETTAE